MIAQTFTAVAEAHGQVAQMVAAIAGTLLLVIAAVTPMLVSYLRAKAAQKAAEAQAAAAEAEGKAVRAQAELERARQEADEAKRLNVVLVKQTEGLINQVAADPETKKQTKNSITVAANDAGVADALKATVDKVKEETK